MTDLRWDYFEGCSRLREAWRRGETTFGGWLVIGDTYTAELVSAAGFDWVGLDMQHGLISRDKLPSMLQALAIRRSPSIVRVAWNSPDIVMNALDAGAHGVIVPLINSPDEAGVAAAACRYPPNGNRSWGLTRAGLGSVPYEAAVADSTVICAVMIETVSALAQVDAIARVPGVDALFVGPRDLAFSAGDRSSGGTERPSFEEEMIAVRDACRRAGIVAGVYAGSSEQAIRWANEGFQLVTVVADSTLLARGAATAAREARSFVSVSDQDQ
jgi:4-hydroxy-2-oxoheptanedioate aldolase